MATKKKTKTGWGFVVKRAKVLPKPLYLRFDDESEGDAYVSRLERLLDAGVAPSREIKRTGLKPVPCTKSDPLFQCTVVGVSDFCMVSSNSSSWYGLPR
jgi:hypothetical protein